jgi:hypothetical protein
MLLLVSVVASCSNGSATAHLSKRAPVSSGQPRAARLLGAPGCHPASPVITSALVGPQVEGTGRGASLWGLLMFRHSLPARVGDQEKIVWRMTGLGSLRLEAIGPGGELHRPAWGPDPHGGSNWDKPGDEWGAGYVFTVPGCWDLHAVRGRATADVWLRVVSR